MPRDLVDRPDWGPPADYQGGRITPGDIGAAWSSAAMTIAGGRSEAMERVERANVPGLADAWDRSDQGVIVKLQNALAAIEYVDSLPAQDRSAVIGSFDRLSGRVRRVILDELALGKPGTNFRPTPEQIADFEDIVGRRVTQGLKNRWRGRYERNVKRVLTRLTRIYQNAGGDYEDELDSWNGRLSVGQTVAIAAALAGE